MSRKIIGITVGTTINPDRLAEKLDVGSSLPTVTEKDEGKILQVEGGKWAAKDLPTYDGEFLVTPSADSDQTLQTAGKYSKSNITVEKIPYSEVSNTAGGTTVIIG